MTESGMYSTLIKLLLNRSLPILFFISGFLVPGLGQVDQSVRYEIPIFNNESSFEVTPAESHGLFLHRYFLGAEKDEIEIILLDTLFNEVWKGVLAVDKGLSLVGKKTDENYFYFLLRHDIQNVFVLYRINQEKGIYDLFPIQSHIRFNPIDFQITQEALLIGGYYNKVPLVLHYDMNTDKSKILPGIFNEVGELTQIKTYDDGTFQVLISATNFQHQNTIWIKNYHADGNLISNYALETDDNKGLLFARSVKTTQNIQVIAGVYGRRNSEYSRGLFTATIDTDGYQQIRYYNFGDLENFFKYMKAKRENRIKDRIERRKVKGKKIKFNYRFLVHEVIEQDGEYIMLGEAFYPTYKTIANNYTFFQPYSNGRNTWVRGNQIFDGYQYTHAAIMGFDNEGKLLWDNSFEIKDVKTWTLDQFVRLEIHEDKIVLLYLFDGEIRSKIIKDSRVIEGKLADPIKPQFDGDILNKENKTLSRLNYWYRDYFYAAGVQDIENYTNESVPPKRKVFFINKITYK